MGLHLKKIASVAFLLLLLGSLVLAQNNFGLVAASEVTGIISVDTTWTKANSPYTLTGNTLVASGVTLRIDQGAIVNLNGYFMMVNGTLHAVGAHEDKIIFNGGTDPLGSIRFNEHSTNWTEATGSGCIIENAIFSHGVISIYGCSPLINSVSFEQSELDVQDGSSVIINSDFTHRDNVYNDFVMGLHGGSAILTNNTINGTIQVQGTQLQDNAITGDIFASASAKINNNRITGNVKIYQTFLDNDVISFTNNIMVGNLTIESARCPLISGNSLNGGISISRGNPIITNNTLFGGTIGLEGGFSNFWPTTNASITGNVIRDFSVVGINFGSMDFSGKEKSFIQDNVVFNCNYGIVCDGTIDVIGNIVYNNTYGIKGGSTVESNLIVNNYIGLIGGGRIQNNTIAYNKIGLETWSTIISYNNIQNNANYNLNYTSTPNVDATNNWWGTTDNNTISQKIYDYKNDFTLGKVNFVPFLSAPNPDAPVIHANLPTSMPAPSHSQSSPVTPTLTNSAEPTTSSANNVGTSVMFGMDWQQFALTVLVGAISVSLVVALFLSKRKKR